MQLREAEAELAEIDANVVGVAAKEDYQAQALIDDGMPFPLLLDPEDKVRAIIGTAERMSPVALLRPAGALAYARSLKRARHFALTVSQATQRPATVVLDSEMNIAWSHLGKRPGDYPDVADALEALRQAGR